MLDWLCRIYEALLRAYPQTFREQYAAEMRRVFREKVGDALRARGGFGVARYCGHVAADLVASVIREHSAADSLGPLSTRFAMLGCLSVIVAVLWFDRRHLGPGWLVLYGASSLLVTSKRSWTRYSLARSTRYGLLGAALFVAVSLGIFFTLPYFSSSRRIESMILLAPAVAPVLWGVAGFQAARQNGSRFAGILAAVWSSMVSVMFHLAVSLVFWEAAVQRFPSLPIFLPLPWKVYATTHAGVAFGTMSWLEWGVIIGLAMGIMGGLAGALRGATPLRPTW